MARCAAPTRGLGPRSGAVVHVKRCSDKPHREFHPSTKAALPSARACAKQQRTEMPWCLTLRATPWSVPTQRACRRLEVVGEPAASETPPTRCSQRIVLPYNVRTARVLRSRPRDSKVSPEDRYLRGGGLARHTGLAADGVYANLGPAMGVDRQPGCSLLTRDLQALLRVRKTYRALGW